MMSVNKRYLLAALAVFILYVTASNMAFNDCINLGVC